MVMRFSSSAGCLSRSGFTAGEPSGLPVGNQAISREKAKG
jgi:hypothetical protein